MNGYYVKSLLAVGLDFPFWYICNLFPVVVTLYGCISADQKTVAQLNTCTYYRKCIVNNPDCNFTKVCVSRQTKRQFTCVMGFSSSCHKVVTLYTLLVTKN